MNEEGRIHLAPDENYIPTGLPGGFFIYNAEGDEEIYFAEQNVIELFGCRDIAEFREYTGSASGAWSIRRIWTRSRMRSRPRP